MFNGHGGDLTRPAEYPRQAGQLLSGKAFSFRVRLHLFPFSFLHLSSFHLRGEGKKKKITGLCLAQGFCEWRVPCIPLAAPAAYKGSLSFSVRGPVQRPQANKECFGF
jgi:hypothetical protein